MSLGRFPVWIDIMVGDHIVRTSHSLKMRIGQDKIAELVRRFIAKKPTFHAFGRNVMCDDAEEEKIGNIHVILIGMTSPKNERVVLCDDKERLVALKVIKRAYAPDGQTRFKPAFENS